MWHVLQIAIFTAVVFSNIRWQWTPNEGLACLYGGMLAFGVTWCLSELFALIRSAWNWLLTWNIKRGPQHEVWCRETQTFIRGAQGQKPGKLTRC